MVTAPWLHMPPIKAGPRARVRSGCPYTELPLHTKGTQVAYWPKEDGVLEQTWNPAPPRGMPAPCPSRDTVAVHAATPEHTLSQCCWLETQGLLSSEGQSPGLQTEVIFFCLHRAEKTEKPTLRSFRRRALIPPQGPHPNDLIPSQRPRLLTASHEVLARQPLSGGDTIFSLRPTLRLKRSWKWTQVVDMAATCAKGPGSCSGLLPGVGGGGKAAGLRAGPRVCLSSPGTSGTPPDLEGRGSGLLSS